MTYRVYARYTTRVYLDVEANSEEEAYEEAESRDFGDFNVIEDSYTEVPPEFYDCEEIG